MSACERLKATAYGLVGLSTAAGFTRAWIANRLSHRKYPRAVPRSVTAITKMSGSGDWNMYSKRWVADQDCYLA
jgi:hypothetical protein